MTRFSDGINPARLRAAQGLEPAGSDLERALDTAIHLAGLPRPERELKLIPGRKFQSDFVWQAARLIVEVEGGTYNGGRHTRGKGFESDAFKYNELTCLGYKIIRVTGKHIKDGSALKWIERILEQSGVYYE